MSTAFKRGCIFIIIILMALILTQTSYSNVVQATTSSAPIPFIAMKVGAAENHTVLLKDDGTVWACGYNEHGRLGDGTTTDRLTPVQVSGLSNVTAIAACGAHTVALKEDGTVWAWGYNGSGQLGDGTTSQRLFPTFNLVR